MRCTSIFCAEKPQFHSELNQFTRIVYHKVTFTRNFCVFVFKNGVCGNKWQCLYLTFVFASSR